MRVLIVDDDPLVARSVARMLKSYGVDASSSTAIDHADQLLTLERFDVVLCDLYLGADSGLELRTRMTARRDLTPFVLFTGDERVHDLREVREGSVSVLAKPCLALALRQVLNRVTPRNR